MYLLDSDIWIFSLRGHAKVAENLAAHAADPKAMSVISYGELLYGAMKSPDRSRTRPESVASASCSR